MKKQLIMTAVFASAFTMMMAQSKPADTVVIRVGEASKVIFAIQDKKDLETLKYYNFQALMDDMISKLEKDDTTTLAKPSTEYLRDTTTVKAETTQVVESNDDDEREVRHVSRGRRTTHSFNIDFGMNNYLENGKFPDQNNSQYTVRPWGSWNWALNSIQRTPMGGKYFLEWGGGVSWYNFKFQDDRTKVTKGPDGVEFTQDIRDYDFVKSKLSTAYINISAVPMIDFGGGSRKSTIFDSHHSKSFRFGVGPYAGYRIDGDAKLVYKENGDKRKEKDHDNFYLNNFRYGVRFQFGFRDTDLFFNYDLNSLFIKGKGPELHAFSFGITL